MRILMLLGVAAITLAACGVDGEPLTPRYSASTTFGVSSGSGGFNSTSLGVHFGN